MSTISTVADWLNRRLILVLMLWLAAIAVGWYALRHPEMGQLFGLSRLFGAVVLGLMFLVRGVVKRRLWFGAVGVATQLILAVAAALDLRGHEAATDVAVYASMIISLPSLWVLLLHPRDWIPSDRINSDTGPASDTERGM